MQAGDTPLSLARHNGNPLLIDALTRTRVHRSSAAVRGEQAAAKVYARQRRDKIREKLLHAAQTSANEWHLLFTDCQISTDTKNADAKSINSRKSSQDGVIGGDSDTATRKQRRTSNGTPSKQTAAANASPCFCYPLLCRLARDHTRTHQQLLDEIDAAHSELSTELSHLRMTTEQKLSDLHKKIDKKQKVNVNQVADDGQMKHGILKSPDSFNQRLKKLRCHSESDLEHAEDEDVTRRSHEYSADSDDVYLQQYRPMISYDLAAKQCEW